jgi:HTH-type transcriptional regulator, sugar sensing transcriptional regulator
MNTESLRRLGLTEGEIKVYLALLETGRVPITLISIKTKLNRTSLYDVIEGLVKKGLVSFVYEEKKKFYKAAKPQRILEYLEEKKQELSTDEKVLKILVKELSNIKSQKEEQLNVEIYRGKKGIKTILEDIFIECKKGDEVLAFGLGGSNFEKLLGSYYHHYIFKHVNDYGIKFKAIFNEDEKEQPYVKELGKIPLTKAKFVFKNYQLPTHTRIYGNKVAIVILEGEPTAILIDDKKVADGYRYFFEFLWNLT